MSTEKAHRYLIAYDVTDDLRRTRAAKVLESYGDRIQYSVFLVDIKPARLIRLKEAVTSRLQLATDSLLICDLGPLTGGTTTHLQLIGATRPITGHEPLVI